MPLFPAVPTAVPWAGASLRPAVPLEVWVAGVVAGETFAHTPVAAREAQAVLARTLAWLGGAHPGGGMCGTTHCMAWRPVPDAGAVAAAARTRGWVLVDGQGPAIPACHASCGGRTAAWPAGFGGVVDPGCQGDTWRRHWSSSLLATLLPTSGMLEARDRTPDGRVTRLRRGEAWMDIERFASRLGHRAGWHALPSHAFVLRPEGDGWSVTGRGHGHGRGLCQRGAAALAGKGFSWQKLLARYLPWARPVRAGAGLLALGSLAMTSLALTCPPATAAPLPQEEARRLTLLVREAARQHLAGARPPRDPVLAKQPPSGVFVTWSWRGKTRACWGRLDPDQPDMSAQV
ncbi:MAG: SpoIID/LytB domain-containing protein, partial [Candidatus Sericytochromatia bacterium]|nr:SpoIID/LytB domain-containing protein [Candidatus Sericytochromatia bacterium]